MIPLALRSLLAALCNSLLLILGSALVSRGLVDRKTWDSFYTWAASNIDTTVTLIGGAVMLGVAFLSTKVKHDQAACFQELQNKTNPKPPTPRPSLTAWVFIAALMMPLTACSTTSQTYAVDALKSATPFLAQGAGVAAGYASYIAAGKPANGGAVLLTLGEAGFTLTSTQAADQDQVAAVFTSFKSDDATSSFAPMATMVATELETFIHQYGGATAQTILTNFFTGLQLAGQALGGSK